MRHVFVGLALAVFVAPASLGLVPLVDEGPWMAWSSETLSTGFVTGSSAIASSNGDDDRIVYADAFPATGQTAMWQAIRTGLTWEVSVLAERARPGDVARDAFGVDHVAFKRNLYQNPHNALASDLGYGKVEDGVTTFETIFTGPWDGVASAHIAVEPDGTPHIVSHRWGGATQYATRSGNGPWTIETIATGTSLWGDVAIDASGRPHAVYSISGTVFGYAVRTGPGTWQTESVSGCHPFVGLAIAVDSAGIPHVACASAAGFAYHTRGSSGWTTEIAATGANVVPRRGNNDVGWEPSLVLDASDRPHMSFRTRFLGTTAPSQLYYATKAGGQWFVEGVDREAVNNGHESGIALDVHGIPRISSYMQARHDFSGCDEDGTANPCFDLRVSEPALAKAFAAAP